MKSLAALFALAVLALPGSLAAQEGTATNAVVRQSLEPATGAVIGQHVALYIDVLFRDAMPRPPRVRLPDIAGIQVFRFETQGTTIQDAIDGAAYVGQRFEFAIYPRRAGDIAVPAAVVTVLDQQGAPAGTVQGTPAQLRITAPPGVDASQPVVATQHMSLNEQWSPGPDRKFKAGGAIVRTITREADDVPSLAMLDLDPTAPDGVRVYADPPDTQDHIERGVLTGKRVDRITYVFSRGGHFDLPAMTQPWWNVAEDKLETAKVPAASIDVAAALATASATAASVTSVTKSPKVIGGVLVIAVLVAGAVAFQWLQRDRPRDVAADAFADLQRACTTTDPARIYRAFAPWQLTLAPEQRKEATDRAGQLYALLFSTDQPAWTQSDSQSLIERLRTLPRPETSARHVVALPPLNPIHERTIAIT